jgi:hypothetical protein
MGYAHQPYNYNNCVIEELSDVDNIMDERELEPDYYIDRPVIIN